jgi:hypothetical protein
LLSAGQNEGEDAQAAEASEEDSLDNEQLQVNESDGVFVKV